MVIRSIVAVCALGSGALLAQALPTEPNMIGQFERIGLVGALMVAVGVLWRSLVKKDDQLVKGTEAMTAALLASAEASKSAVQSTKELKGAIYSLRDGLNELPCTRLEPTAAAKSRGRAVDGGTATVGGVGSFPGSEARG